MTSELSQAIELIKAGKKPEGGRILAGLVKANPDNETAWQWLSTCVVPEAQKRHCLDQVLRINPQSEYAKKALAALDFQPTFNQPPETKKGPFSTIKNDIGKAFAVLSVIFAGLSLVIIPLCFGPVGFIFGLVALITGEKKGGIFGMIANVVLVIVGMTLGVVTRTLK